MPPVVHLHHKAPLTTYWGGIVGCLLAILASNYTGQAYWLAFPVVVILGWFAVFDFKKLYYLLLFSLPFTIPLRPEFGSTIDFPADPLMIILTLAGLLYFTHPSNRQWFKQLPIWRHPLLHLLMLYYGWTGITILFSEDRLVSGKFFLAKSWYLFVFTVLTACWLGNRVVRRTICWVLLTGISATVLYALLRHAEYGFAFKDINEALAPLYRNHVNYAALLSLFIPFVGWRIISFPKYSWKRWALGGVALIWLLGIGLSYTRTAWVALVLAGGFYFLVKKKWVWKAGVLALILLAGLLFYLLWQNRYMGYAPNFKKTVYHHRFVEHLEATAQLQDISTMERVYRWIAAARMSREHPVTGFGPGNFYPYYKRYTVPAFATYMSDNPDRSGVHNYFLLMLTEQGWIGLGIFLILTFAIFRYGVCLWHRVQEKARKREVMTVLLSLFIIYGFLCLSDLVEAVKIGPFYFMNITWLACLDIEERLGNSDS